MGDVAVTSKEDSLIRTIVIIEMSACAAVATARQLRKQRGGRVKAIGTSLPDDCPKKCTDAMWPVPASIDVQAIVYACPVACHHLQKHKNGRLRVRISLI